MKEERHPDPNCPFCHGSGVIVLAAPFLDRIDEVTKPCRCVTAKEEEPAVAVSDGDHE